VNLAGRDRVLGIAIAVVTVVAVVTATGVFGSGSPGPRIGTPGGQANDTRFGWTAVRVGQLRSFGAMMICSENATRPIRIASVTTLSGATNLTVIDFGTRPNPFLQKNKEALGSHLGTTASLGFHSRSVAVCGPPVNGPDGTGGSLATTTELAVTLRNTAPLAHTDGFTLSYVIAGKTHSFTLYDNLTLCTAATTQADPAQCGGG
jgi:hypothetical protein